MADPTYDDFVTVESWDVERAYKESRGHPPAISDMYHNAYRRLVEGWSHENILRDIRGQSISNGPSPTTPVPGPKPTAPGPNPPSSSEPTTLPNFRGPFRFPDPYNTRAVRLTDARDGLVYPCGYSYWSRINNHRDRDSLLVLVGLKPYGPSIVEVDKRTHQVVEPRPLFASGTSWAADEADQWYFSATDPDAIYCCHGRDFCRVAASDGKVDVVFSTNYGAFLFQPHSSDDGKTHSATVQNADYQAIGCLVWKNGRQTFYPRDGDYDECQIDAGGHWLIIKQNDDNRIVDLETGRDRIIRNKDGAVGHSDCGAGMIVGEDDQHDPPGRMVSIDLESGQPSLMYGLDQWVTGLGHVAVRGNVALVSNAHRQNYLPVNDLILVPLDGSLTYRAVAPNLVNLDAAGGGDDYKKQPMANLDPLAQYACWSSNHGSDRIDLFLVQLVQ